MSIISLKNISFSYEEKIKNSFFLIDKLHFKIEESDFISIMGPNGSGKSTLLKIIANLLKPFSGNVLLDDVDYSFIPRNVFARKVSFVPQSSKVFFPYSVYEIVMMGRTPHLNYFGIENEIDHNKVIEVLELLEIDHLKNKGINEVSGGEAQRALIARALVQEPKIMLLDEPNAHLDIKHQVSIFNILLKLNKEFGLTVVLISHDLNLANFFSNRVVLMNNGKIEFDSAPKEVLTEDNIKLIFNVNSKVMKSINSPETFINISPKL